MRYLPVGLAALLVSLGSSKVPAQETAHDVGSLQEIVVTATKRATLEQQTPISMTVIGPDTLRDNRIEDFADFAVLVPGLTYTDTGPGTKRFALRGLQSPGEPEVALYYDEIPISGLPGLSLDTGASQPDLKLWDMERIEVLRGPEGTLYGNGSEGGAIRILSRRPDLANYAADLEALGGFTDGGAGSWGVNGMFNAPLIPGRLAVRAVIYDRDDGGYIDALPLPNIDLKQLDQRNDNSERTRGARLSFSWQVADDWNITGITYYQRLFAAASFETYPNAALPNDRYVSNAYVQTPWTDDSHMYNLISNTEFSWADFVATGSYQRREVQNNTDTTRFLLSEFHCTVTTWDQTCFGPPLIPATAASFESVDAWSAETRLVSRGPSRFQWTAGAFLQNSSTVRNGQVGTDDSGGFLQYDPSTGDVINRLFSRDNLDKFDQYAFFGDANYAILSDVKADIGLRWFHSDRSDQQVIVQQFFPGEPTGPEPYQNFKQGVLFKSFSLSDQITTTKLVYVQASQGFRAGGPNYPGGFTAVAPPYRADSVWDYELGAKLGFLSNRVTLNSSIFDIEWSNLQVLVPAAVFSYISNAGSARSTGFETELTGQVTAHFSIVAGLTLNDAKLVGPQPSSSDPSQQLEAGDHLAGVPEWTGNLSLQYKSAWSDSVTASARADLSYQSGRRSTVATENPGYFVSPAYTLTNLHLTLDRRDGWGISLDVTNLFNQYVELSAQLEDSNLIRTVTPARPLTVTAGLHKQF